MVRRGGTILACIPHLTRVVGGRIAVSMGLFAQQKTIDRLEDRLRSLELECDDLQRGRKNLDLEFTELYDKVRHQMSRMAKRDARAAKANGGEVPLEPPTSPSDGLDPISREILARRAQGKIRA